MHFNLIRNSLLLSATLFTSVLALNYDGAHDQVVPERKLRAAKRSHKLSSRQVKGCLSYDHQLHYLDGE